MIGKWIYAPGKNDIKAWRCTVKDNKDSTATIITENKRGLQGKVVSRPEIVSEGKQKRTYIQQAVFMANSKYKKKRDSGYQDTVPTDNIIRNTLGFPAPQLAKSVPDDLKLESDYSWQPKLDGHRCVVALTPDGIKMYSRKGIEITTMGHIAEFITSKATRPINSVSENIYLDGELYIHGKTLQELSRVIKKKSDDSAKVQLHLYDYFVEKQFHVQFLPRFSSLTLMQTVMGLPFSMSGDKECPICIVDTLPVSSKEHLKSLNAKAIKLGYEGGILRNNGAIYTPGQRNYGLYKVKEFDDHEYEIFEVIKGKPKILEDAGTLEQAIFRVWINKAENKTLEVLSPGSMYEKAKHWKNRAKLIGKMLTVKHSGFTDDGIPFHAVAMQLREDI